MKRAPKRKRKRASSILLPSEAEVTAMRERLPHFDPHDLRSLLNEARSAAPQGDTDMSFTIVLRERNNHQINELLNALDIDRSKADFWQRAFIALAFIDHGMGHLQWRPQKTKKNAATWTLDHNIRLFKEMATLTANGLSDRAAIKKLAKDDRKQKLFPYRPKLGAGGAARREAALWRHWQKLRSRQPGLEAALGVEPRGSIEAFVDQLELNDMLVKIESAPKQDDL
jgi:hypothetical protein